MAFWPFSKVFGAGLVAGDVPTHGNLNLLDEQLAQAADGAVWTDLAAIANMIFSIGSGSANDVTGAVWRAISSEWYVVGRTGFAPTVRKAFPPFTADSLQTMTVPLGAGYNQSPSIACNPAGVLLMYDNPNSGTAQKLRRSVDGTTWTVEDTVQALPVKTMGWFPAASKWIAGYGSGTAIDTSSDGITWSAVTVPNSAPRSAMAASPTRLVIVSAPDSARNAILTTDDAVTWTARAVPSAFWKCATYNAARQRWFIGTEAGGIYTSPDAVTWTAAAAVPNTGPTIQALHSIGRAVVAVGEATGNLTEVWCSVDGAVSWQRLARWKFGAGVIASASALGPGGQLAVLSALQGEARFGLRVG